MPDFTQWNVVSRIAKFTIDVFMKINGQAVFKDLIQNVRLIFSA